MKCERETHEAGVQQVPPWGVQESPGGAGREILRLKSFPTAGVSAELCPPLLWGEAVRSQGAVTFHDMHLTLRGIAGKSHRARAACLRAVPLASWGAAR